ncbi:hypothetical protein GSI_09012 [Ganoderma sinense ZZ0214-1]|uniref:Uncharacterized protein n=1 Tax=Ganoderma sinense ZZ0214-1 TaxID=1077348 RepID=A0A2G8S5D9_9APHY|nr:hypothetical protein GSI_09012 [Ganoderma sinense ZZ0214-1]
MAYSMSYASQGFCDPTTMIQTPHGRESMSSPFNFGAASAIWEAPQDPTKPFDLQRIASINLSIPELFGPSPTSATGFHMTAPTPPPIPSVQSSGCYETYPSTFFQPTEALDLFDSQPNTRTAHTAISIPVTPNPFPSTSSIPFWETDRIVPVCHRDHSQEPSTAGPRVNLVVQNQPSHLLQTLQTPLPICMRKPLRVGTPHPGGRPQKPQASLRPFSPPLPPLPQRTDPITKVEKGPDVRPASGHHPPHQDPAGIRLPPRCPMPKCGAEIEACDAAWRGHFKAMHHDDLCLLPGCDGVSPRCKARCPCPLPGSKTKACERGTMAIESVGRHLLNVHVGVAYACPVCGMERTWRESACARHIRLCLRKREEANSKKGGGR